MLPAVTPTETTSNLRNLWPIVAVAMAVAVGAFVLFLAITEEPYHIDELRQTNSYFLDLPGVIDSSLQQEQPPLDPVLNAIAQRAIGVGDFKQRLLSVLFGIASLAVFGALMLRSGFKWGSALAVAVLGLSPLLVSVTAYARPYALPLFLILGLLFLIEVWLHTRQRWTAVGIVGVSLILPLSRTVEPTLALGAIVVVLVFARIVFKPSWRGSVWLPVAAASAGIVLVSVPVIAILRSELDDFTAGGDLGGKLTRLITDLPSALADTFTWWPFFVVAVLLALTNRSLRSRIGREWWFWVLLAVPAGFAVIFMLQTTTTQPYFARYTFTWWPPVAVVVGALADHGISQLSSANSETTSSRASSAVASLSLFAVLAISVSLAVGTVHSLTSVTNGDWQAASSTIVDSTQEETVVIMEHIRPLDAYHIGTFYGRRRYLPPSKVVQTSTGMRVRPDAIAADTPVAILLLGRSPALPGFHRFRIDQAFTLYLPIEPLEGPRGAAKALEIVAAALPPDVGSHSALTAATLYTATDDLSAACSLVVEYELVESTNEKATLRILRSTPDGGAWIDGC